MYPYVIAQTWIILDTILEMLLFPVLLLPGVVAFAFSFDIKMLLRIANGITFKTNNCKIKGEYNIKFDFI